MGLQEIGKGLQEGCESLDDGAGDAVIAAREGGRGEGDSMDEGFNPLRGYWF